MEYFQHQNAELRQFQKPGDASSYCSVNNIFQVKIRTMRATLEVHQSDQFLLEMNWKFKKKKLTTVIDFIF